MSDSARPSMPLCLAMVLADCVWRDPMGPNRYSLLGILHTLRPPAYPFVMPALGAYVALTDGRGRVPLSLRVVRADDPNEEPLSVLHQELDFAGPRILYEVGFSLNRVVFTRPGEYLVQLRGGGQLLQERRLTLLPLAPAATGGPPG